MVGRCDGCGNTGDTFQVTMNGETYRFDSFECAIRRLAARCHHCLGHILGQKIEVEGKSYCCTHCARYSPERRSALSA